MVTVGSSYVYDVQFPFGTPAATTAAIGVNVVDAHGVHERSIVMPSIT
ncbi:MAG: hypothetical protein ACJAZO_003929 [Myxococcota bacterium]|jgi:hypothetical protein